MSIEDRSLVGVSALVARYRKEEHHCTVAREGDGTLRFVLEGGRSFRSPSAAGSAVMGGIACNGWRFWTPSYPDGVSPLAAATITTPGAETEETASEGAVDTGASTSTSVNRTARAAAAASAPRAPKVLRRVPNQRGVPEGQTRWFCSACMDGFLVSFGTTPEQCPQGHGAA